MTEHAEEERLKAKYKCTASKNGGWCDGTKVGKRMGCPHHCFSATKQRLCEIGIRAGINYQDSAP